MTRAIAVDWSGDVRAETGTHPKLWVAEACDGDLITLEPSSRQRAVGTIRSAADRHGAGLVVGLDFAFSYPSWFLLARCLTSGPELWTVVDGLAFDQPPFFGAKGTRAPSADRRLRRTEVLLRQSGFPAKSVFQLCGPGSVGTGSRMGMPHLGLLRNDGFAIWPFDDANGTAPVVAEIYPRTATGLVVKSNPAAQQTTFDDHLVPEADDGLRALAISSEDAFDAAVSAVGLSRSRAPATPPESDAAAMEGWVLS